MSGSSQPLSIRAPRGLLQLDRRRPARLVGRDGIVDIDLDGAPTREAVTGREERPRPSQHHRNDRDLRFHSRRERPEPERTYAGDSRQLTLGEDHHRSAAPRRCGHPLHPCGAILPGRGSHELDPEAAEKSSRPEAIRECAPDDEQRRAGYHRCQHRTVDPTRVVRDNDGTTGCLQELIPVHGQPHAGQPSRQPESRGEGSRSASSDEAARTTQARTAAPTRRRATTHRTHMRCR